MDYVKLLSGILQQYDIGNLKGKPKVLDGGYVNFNLKFETDKGIFVLKKYANEFAKNPKKLINMLEFLYNIKTSTNFSVAKPFKTLDDNFLLNYENAIYSISEFIEGGSYSDDWHDAKLVSAARTLARLHKETQKAVPDSENVLKKVKYTGSIESLWDVSKIHWKEISLKDKIEQKENKSKVDLDILNIYIPFVQKEFQKYLNELKHIKQRTNLSMTHQDYWWGQLAFQGHEVAAVFDFDLMQLDYAQYDLVKASRGFAHFRAEIDKKTGKVLGFDLNKLKLFIDSYKEIFGKIDIEPEEVMVFLRHAILDMISYWIGRYENTQGILEENNIKLAIMQVQWLEKNKKLYTDLFR